MKPFAHLDDGFRDYLKQLIDSGRLREESGNVSLGITNELLDKGFEFLTGNQIKTFYNYVIGKLVISKCGFCKQDILWSEMFEALDNGNFCQTCAETHAEVMKKKAVKANN